MFFGHLSTMDITIYPPAIQQALRFLQETDFDQLDVGRYPIKGDLIYAQLLELETKPKAEILPEVHRNYIDVQYLHSGYERIGFAPDLGINPIAIDYSAERDIQFYHSVDVENELIMQAGNFAVFFPNDIHRPACIDGNVTTIRKVVVKIAISEI